MDKNALLVVAYYKIIQSLLQPRVLQFGSSEINNFILLYINYLVQITSATFRIITEIYAHRTPDPE